MLCNVLLQLPTADSSSVRNDKTLETPQSGQNLALGLQI